MSFQRPVIEFFDNYSKSTGPVVILSYFSFLLLIRLVCLKNQKNIRERRIFPIQQLVTHI